MLSNNTLFAFLSLVSFMNYLDRGIIPGASQEFNEFIDTELNTTAPDKYLGLLQSIFVAGFSIACLPFSHALHHYRWNTLLTVTLFFWTLVLLGCGLSGESFGGFYMLATFRGLSGVAEATFQCIIPPLIQDRAKDGKVATVLSLYFTSIPLGIAVGYMFGSSVAASYPWRYCYYIEVIIMIPILLFLCFPLRYSENEQHDENQSETQGLLGTTSPLITSTRQKHALSNSDRHASQLPNIADARQLQVTEKPSFLDELVHCLSSPIFVLIALSYAVYVGERASRENENERSGEFQCFRGA